MKENQREELLKHLAASLHDAKKEGGASTIHLNLSSTFELEPDPAVPKYRRSVEYRNPQPFVPFTEDEGLFL